MKKIIFSFVFIVSLVFPQDLLYAQRGYDWSGPWGVGVGIGSASYIGDLGDHPKNQILMIPQNLGVGAHGFFSKGFGPLAVILQMNMGKLQAKDYRKDHKFSNSYYEYIGMLRLDLNKLLQGKNYRRENWNAYAQAGLGMYRFHAQLTDIAETELIADYGYTELGKASSIVAGGGIIYYMTDDAHFHIGVDYHFLNGDGGDSIDAKKIGSSKDHYLYMNLGFSFTFGSPSHKGGRRRSLLWGKF